MYLAVIICCWSAISIGGLLNIVVLSQIIIVAQAIATWGTITAFATKFSMFNQHVNGPVYCSYIIGPITITGKPGKPEIIKIIKDNAMLRNLLLC